MTKKFELTSESKEFNGVTVFRIRALKAFANVKKGDLGGWVEREGNLAQEGRAWIYNQACAYGDAFISGRSFISGYSVYSGVNSAIKEAKDD